MKLHYRIFNKGEALFILHGLYGSSDNWISIAKKINSNYNIIIPDLRNHGQSPHSPLHNYRAMAKDIKQLADSLGLKQIHIIGHSMGGKVAMEYACMFPESTKSIIVVDIAPKNYNNKEYQHHIEHHKNIIEQMLNYNFEGKKSRTEIDTDFSVNINDKATRQFILKNIKRKEGCFEWKININSIYNNLHKIMDNSLKKDYLFNKPALFIKAENSDYITKKDIDSIKKIFPLAQLTTIQYSSHWVHTDQPEILIKTINTFY